MLNIAGYTITPKTITVVVDGATRIIDSSRDGFDEIPKLLFQRKRAQAVFATDNDTWSTQDEDRLAQLLDMRKFIVRQTHGAVEIADDRVLFKGLPIEGVLVDRLIEMQTKGYDTEPLALFLANLMANPIESAREELYLWLEGAKMPITDDGHFLAWKAVRSDYRSHHDSATWNGIGSKPTVPRDYCDTDRHRTCSTGLHFCSYEYLPSFAGSDSRIMIVKINPADVVAIPNDYSNTKGRAWTYEVIGEVPREEVPDFFKVPVVSAHVNDIEQIDPAEWDDDDDEAMGPDIDRDEEMRAEDAAGAYDAPDAETTGPYDVPEHVALPTGLDAPVAIVSIPEPAPVITKKTLRSLLKKYSQRRVAKDTGIPRTTLQEMIYRWWPEKDKRPTKKD